MELPYRFKELLEAVRKDPAHYVDDGNLTVTVGGWVRSCRKAGKLIFLQLYDDTANTAERPSLTFVVSTY